ncbi:MAG: type II toxin-antitoxin system VapC family toxin [Gammaproteobacteria bacterium]|nr:type II toxin-antitoxin system VapC family toxin [Gammaproteobacteria bacterium]
MVVDSSVLVSALVEQGPIGTWAELVVAEGELVAPEIALVETTDVLRRLERASLITSDEANAAQAGLLVLDVLLYPFAPFADRVWALQANLTCDDAWYVALAEAQDMPLATLDAKASRAAGPKCKFLLPQQLPVDRRSQ